MTKKSIIVSRESFQSDEPYEIIYSNIQVLNALFDEYIAPHEVSQDALRSYYVDYYLAEMNNGGFSQFVYNSGWEHKTIEYVVEGVEKIGAHKHLEQLRKSAELLERLGSEGIERFFESDYFGDNEERDFLNAYDDQFVELLQSEDLTDLNATWLRNHADLVVLSEEEIQHEVQKRAASIPDRASRVAKALEAEPRYMKIIRALCEASSQTLSRVTAGDPSYHHHGKRTIAWHFLTDKGHHYMIDVDGKAIMYNGSKDIVTEISIGEEFGMA